VSGAVAAGETTAGSIPERRGVALKEDIMMPASGTVNILKLPLPVWRCKVCGYLCARESPPELCPICKAKKERFEKFL
jgi:ferredoxin-thioredoxin reductase catalytic chain